MKQRCLEIKAHIDLNLDGVSARPSLQELERIATERHDSDAASRASGELGILAFLEGNPKEARNRVLGAILKSALSGDTGAQIRYLSLLGQGLAEGHKPKQALWPLNRALAIAQNAPDVGFPKLVVSGKASSLTQLGRFGEAHDLIEQGLRYARDHHFFGFEADMLAQSAQLAEAQHQIPEAISLYERAAYLAKQIKFNRGVAEINAALASLYQRAGNLPQALAAEQTSIDAHLKMGEVYQLPHHLAFRAELERQVGLNAAANRTYDEAEQIVGTMLKNSPTAGIKRSVIGAMSEIYLGHFRLAVAEHNIAEAYRIIEEARGRVSADRLRSPEQDRRPRPEIALAERNLTLLQVQLFSAEDKGQRAKISDEITELEDQTPFDEADTLPSRKLSLKDLQASLLPNEAVVEYVLDDPASYCLIIKSSGIESAQIIDRKSIGKLIANDLTAIKSKSLARGEGQALYAAIIKPIAPMIQDANLIVIPDGDLNSVPFAALSDTEGRYLIQTRSVDYAPSGTILALARGPHDGRERRLLAIGNVAYGNESRPIQNASFFRGLESLTRNALHPLPATRDEVRSVAATMSDLNGVVLSGTSATESNFKREVAKNPSVVHLAVHAFADKDLCLLPMIQGRMAYCKFGRFAACLYDAHHW